MKKALLTFIILLVLVSAGEAQNGQNSWRDMPNKKFDPSMVAIIIVLMAALFFMGFFSIYIRNRSFGAPGPIRVLRASFQRRAAATSGLDRDVINMFPTFKYSEVKELRVGKEALECAVCLNEFEEEDILRLLPKCDHVFHPECIDEWLSSHVTCPVCRTNLVPEPEDVPQGEISIQVPENEVSEAEQSQPLPLRFVDRRSKSTTMDRPPRSGSVRSGREKLLRSMSTGNSLIKWGENVDRFTLRFQDEFHRQVMMNRALNRTTSCYVTTLPRESSSRSGYRTGFGGRSRSTRVGRSNSRPSDRWLFSMAPPFFTRTPSVRSDTALPAQGDATASSSGLATRTFIKLPSLQRRDVKGEGMHSTLLPV